MINTGSGHLLLGSQKPRQRSSVGVIEWLLRRKRLALVLPSLNHGIIENSAGEKTTSTISKPDRKGSGAELLATTGCPLHPEPGWRPGPVGRQPLPLQEGVEFSILRDVVSFQLDQALRITPDKTLPLPG